MRTAYQLNADELNSDFIEAIKALYRHKTINVSIQEADDKEGVLDVSRFSEMVLAENENKRQAALAHIAALKIDWQGKPMADRDTLYDEARG